MGSFLNIGKIRGAIFSFIIIAFYYYVWLPYLHYEWFGFDAPQGWGTRVVFIGLLMTQVIITQPGDTARLTFFGAVTDRTWGNGVALLPNILHTTIVMFRFAILWGVAVLSSNTYKRYEEPDVTINTSDSNMKYHANVEMSYTQAQVSRVGDIFLRLFFDYKRVPEEYYVASFGYRVLVIGIVVVCINSAAMALHKKTTDAVYSATGWSQPYIQQTNPVVPRALGAPTYEAVIKNNRKKLNQTILERKEQLEVGKKPLFPSTNNFVAQQEKNDQFFALVQGDQRRYHLFHEPHEGELRTLVVKESMCALVPPGREIAFVTKWAPTNAENMEEELIYTKKSSLLTIVDHYQAWLAGMLTKDGLPDKGTWEFVHKNWHTVETFNRRLIAKAKPQYKMRKYEPGGIVCF